MANNRPQTGSGMWREGDVSIEPIVAATAARFGRPAPVYASLTFRSGVRIREVVIFVAQALGCQEGDINV